MRREPEGSPTPPAFLPAAGESPFDLHLDDDEPLLLELQQAHEPVLGHLVLDEAEDVRRRADRLADAEELEQLLVSRVVDARDRLADAVALLRDLGDDEVVLVVPGHRQHELRGTGDAGALEHRDLGRVAADHDRPELLLEQREAIGSLLDQRDLVAQVDQRAGHVGAHLPASCDDDVHQTAASGTPARTVSRSDEIAVCVGQTMLMPRSE